MGILRKVDSAGIILKYNPTAAAGPEAAVGLRRAEVLPATQAGYYF